MHGRTVILGLNAWHGDSAAALIVDGQLVAAAEEERFRRVKHWAGFPSQAVRYCLESAGLTLADVDHVAINRDPRANLLYKLGYALRRRPSFRLLRSRLANASRVRDLRAELIRGLGACGDDFRARVHHVEHHRAHLASAYLVSPFQSAAVVSVDGFGDFSSAMWAHGHGTDMVELGRVRFPHSLGLYYLALTQHLGFPNYGDEYKVMGMAAYGEPVYLDALRRVVKLRHDGGFELNLDYFVHHKGGVPMTWDGGEPRLGRAFSPKLEELLGPARFVDEALEQRHYDLAASIQAMYEEAFFHMLCALHAQTGETSLCVAGGCGMNSLANGRITTQTPFEEVYVQAAAGDAGGSIGAAAEVWCGVLGRRRLFTMDHAYFGPQFDAEEIGAVVAAAEGRIDSEGCEAVVESDEGALCERVAEAIAEGKVVGWFQGRMEWGPRALGNRSILGDPRRSDLKDILNLKIKRRESFRPFAPSVLREHMSAWFDQTGDVPFMGQVFPIREEKRDKVPAVTHADGTGRLQTVERATNPRYWRLIRAFEERTGVPMLVNTSFNENEPVVCHPREALDCFLRTKMDLLVLGDHLIERVSVAQAAKSVAAALPASGGVPAEPKRG
ncbi:carbamoyltransferase [Engelhardtia mirabilis]|uniref:Decarbamoylnovobiocin carbamoyltransferase n=1 Tax=Engelhardtia mirabilis TaxID=2528011 RepID=A0A518BJG3_9BACT|nr:Decarbamoylnovobiocin carbamoyltransferase [Planctomycetes bacterium Pla133]QDV01456.1 Decarbamoylnovobiocin carbamoyltransferase [Planctomycetes bacterium Pla86]